MIRFGRSLLLSVMLLGLLSCLALFSIRTVHVRAKSKPPASKTETASKQTSVAAFEAIVPVLHNPRCMNCHMKGDYPRQGEDSHPHIMQVRRGPDGHGAAPVRCSTCHQDHNLVGIHMPPGAPDWALPAPAHPMIWQDLTDRQLCLLLKDPQQNGHRTVAQIVEHMHTPMVLWGWHPGDGRRAIPMPEAEFEGYVELWAARGAVCPSR